MAQGRTIRRVAAGEREGVVSLDVDPARPDPALEAILDELDARAPALADRMVQRYRANIPTYAALPETTLAQIRELNLGNVTGFVRAMRERRRPARHELDLIAESAVKRAREGVPLSALLAAYRIGAKDAWGEILDIVGREDLGALRAGLELATAVLAWVDEVSSVVAQTYLEEYERISTDREAARRDFVDAVVVGGLTGDEIRARAEALGMDPDQPSAVALIALAEDPEDGAVARVALNRIRARLTDLVTTQRAIESARGAQIVLIFHGDQSVADAIAAELRAIIATTTTEVGIVAGVGRPRESVADLTGSHREATLAITAARAGASAPVAVYGEVLVEELILRERGVSRRLAQTILEPLAAFPDLKTTLVEYIKHGPALPTVARKLFLHPNTVAYRLARIRELTGRDPKTPTGISELFLALRASQLVGDEQA